LSLIVNGQRIDSAVLDSEFAQIKSYFEHLGNVSCCERDPEFRGYARDNVVARALLSQEAQRRLQPVADDEVDAAVAKLISDYGGEVQFYAASGARPDTMQLVRHDVELELRVRRMVEQMCADISPSEDDLRRYYNEHLASFMTDEQVRASHILKAPKRGEARAEAFEELRKLRTQLLAGEDFEKLAKAHSDKADEHIDLGFFKRGELAEEFEIVAFSLNVGEISPVFLSPFGFHLITVTERKPAMPKPFEDVRAEVEQRYRDEIRDQRTKTLVEELKKSATVEEAEDAPAEAAAV
jgi:parvulin-like peptidyl-prolyl isomerase